MKNKVCSCCKNKIDMNSVKAGDLYLICVEFYDYHSGFDYDYRFYVKCNRCNSLIKITLEEVSEILDKCGYKYEHGRIFPHWYLEKTWIKDYPNNFIQVDYRTDYNPNDIFKLKVEINISNDIISNLANARKYLNSIQSILNDNSTDKKCAEANYELQHILNEYDSLEKKIKTIIDKED